MKKRPLVTFYPRSVRNKDIAEARYRSLFTDRNSVSVMASLDARHDLLQIIKIGKLRDRAEGDVRDALNHVLHILSQPSRIRSASIGFVPEFPKIEKSQKPWRTPRLNKGDLGG